MAGEVRFEKWELDDLRAAQMNADYEEAVDHDRYASLPRFTEFLNRVVEVADRNRARNAKLPLTT